MAIAALSLDQRAEEISPPAVQTFDRASDNFTVGNQSNSDSHIFLPVDFDFWAWNDECVRLLLFYTFTRRRSNNKGNLRTWKLVIELFWRSRLTKTEIAECIGLERESVRSLIKTIRQTARELFSEGAELRPALTTRTRPTPQPFHWLSHLINERDVIAACDGSRDAQFFIEAYKASEVARWRAKPFTRDPFEGRTLFSFGSDLKTDYEKQPVGRPRKLISANLEEAELEDSGGEMPDDFF